MLYHPEKDPNPSVPFPFPPPAAFCFATVSSAYEVAEEEDRNIAAATAALTALPLTPPIDAVGTVEDDAGTADTDENDVSRPFPASAGCADGTGSFNPAEEDEGVDVDDEDVDEEEGMYLPTPPEMSFTSSCACGAENH